MANQGRSGKSSNSSGASNQKNTSEKPVGKKNEEAAKPANKSRS